MPPFGLGLPFILLVLALAVLAGAAAFVVRPRPLRAGLAAVAVTVGAYVTVTSGQWLDALAIGALIVALGLAGLTRAFVPGWGFLDAR